MAECIVCYDGPQSGCTVCTAQWCTSCAEKIQRCPQCRIDLQSKNRDEFQVRLIDSIINNGSDRPIYQSPRPTMLDSLVGNRRAIVMPTTFTHSEILAMNATETWQHTPTSALTRFILHERVDVSLGSQYVALPARLRITREVCERYNLT